MAAIKSIIADILLLAAISELKGPYKEELLSDFGAFIFQAGCGLRSDGFSVQ